MVIWELLKKVLPPQGYKKVLCMHESQKRQYSFKSGSGCPLSFPNAQSVFLFNMHDRNVVSIFLPPPPSLRSKAVVCIIQSLSILHTYI